ncbi:uncharacterized protein B4U79_15814 [Dinothrombium tinctorium]|uniref:Rho-GAP domain-containing protein n=1 Tax=Dinothrombium tinctorium TaxID=1965070 RepID=A0A3S3SEC4_9ACAR|nr:uncharacterized protein B4U79_15814 [Dinothrombium tinctorium]
MFSRILPSSKHCYHIERVKFGAPLDQVCGIHNQIPGPLLILILKLNKEAPFKKDVFRAPGHQANMKKLIHFLQTGRLVNIDKFSVYTIASVLKKFLRKIPGGIFGPEIESRLFDIIHKENIEEKREEIHRLIKSLPVVNQQLLVLLFGTFRAIASSSEKASTGMTSEAIGVSVAPSFFQSCVSDGSKIAKMEDVHRFKVATTIMKFLIDNFGVSNLFGRENYEYYARISGRVLKVEENWIFAFKYPPDNLIPRKTSLEAEREWLHSEAQRWGLPLAANRQLQAISSSEECQSTPTLCPSTSGVTTSVISRGGEHGSHSHATTTLVDEAYARLSMSLEENVFKVTTPKSPSSPAANTGSSASSVNSHQRLQDQKQQGKYGQPCEESINLDELKIVNRYAESTKSLSFLPMVHERQTQRMKTRSEWFLNPSESSAPLSPSSAGKAQKTVIRRTSSKEKRLVRRSSSKKDKENGKSVPNTPVSASGGLPVSGDLSSDVPGVVTDLGTSSGCNITESDCTEMDVQSFHFTLTYKPRI